MKKIVSAIILIIELTSCKNSIPKNTFTLNGTIQGDVPSYLFIEYGKVKDCTLVKNGKFKLIGHVDRPTRAYISVHPISSFINDWFPLENNKIQLKITINKKVINKYTIDFIKLDTVVGSKTYSLMNNFKKFENKHKNDKDWNFKLNLKLTDLINKNPDNFYINYLLIEEAKKGSLTKTQIMALYKKIDTTLLSAKQLVLINNIIFPETFLKKGSQLVDFSLPGVNNKLVNTKSFRGKILLIDFWASWCAPCRKVNPELLKIYNKNKNKDFEILGVSLDTNIEKWKNAVAKDNLNWVNVIQTEGFNSKIAAKYNVTGVPTNYLIDENGKILANNISLTDLIKILNKLLR